MQTFRVVDGVLREVFLPDNPARPIVINESNIDWPTNCVWMCGCADLVENRHRIQHGCSIAQGEVGKIARDTFPERPDLLKVTVSIVIESLLLWRQQFTAWRKWKPDYREPSDRANAR